MRLRTISACFPAPQRLVVSGNQGAFAEMVLSLGPLLSPPSAPTSAEEAGSGQAGASLQQFLTVDQ